MCIDSKGPILSRHPERFYDWIAEANISVPELLLVPLYINGSLPLGTLWIVSAAEGHFDSGDARVLTELASFAGIALRMLESGRQLKAALQRQAAMTKEQEIVAREMHHRVKNLFAITNGMIRVSARSASTPLEMADILTGRLHALSNAHALVRRSPEDPPTIIGSHIHEVITTILRPHEDSGTARNRFVVKGPPIRLGDRATNGVALVFHELATNAVKYGALRAENGSVEVTWRQDGGTIFLQWNERGGPPVGGAPSNTGFGTALSKNTVVGQLGGTLYYDWRPEGLRVSISVPADNLAV